MSKETDVALKNLLIEVLDNLEAGDVLANANLKPSGANKRSVSSSIKRAKKILGALSVEAEVSAVGGIPYKGSFIKDVKSVTEVRQKGRSTKDGTQTPLEDWGGYELLSYFFELYYGRTGKEFPLECPGVIYQKFVKSKGQWEGKVTRGLSVMTRLMKVLGSADQVKAYIDWWFTTSFSNKAISWGWLASATMIATFQSHIATSTVRHQNPLVTKDMPLPADFVKWVDDNVPDANKYVSVLKTHKQLKYVYNAWSSRMCDESHPIIRILREAVSRGLIKELK